MSIWSKNWRYPHKVSTNVTSSQKLRLKKLAAKHGATVSSFLRLLIEQTLQADAGKPRPPGDKA